MASREFFSLLNIFHDGLFPLVLRFYTSNFVLRTRTQAFKNQIALTSEFSKKKKKNETNDANIILFFDKKHEFDEEARTFDVLFCLFCF